MVDKPKPCTLTVYLYVPNIIGYVRILMNCYAFAICFKDKYLFSILYLISFVCDALDGWFARKLNQVSTFGAVLDMITDRISTVCLLVVLSQVYRPRWIFLSLLALDIASHWLQMYSTFLVGKSSHKDVNDSSSWLLSFIMGIGNLWVTAAYAVRCISYVQEQHFKSLGWLICWSGSLFLYIVLFLLAKNQIEDLTTVLENAAAQNWLYLTLLPPSLVGWAIKQLVNVIQMKTAADACIVYDIGKKQ